MAEEKGFEPLRHFRALRDFESRLFDQLEYSSVGLAYYINRQTKNQGHLIKQNQIINQTCNFLTVRYRQQIILPSLIIRAERGNTVIGYGDLTGNAGLVVNAWTNSFQNGGLIPAGATV